MSSDVPHDALFDNIPRGSSYFFIWRVKAFELVEVPKQDYGNFFKGDSYIVICCTDRPNQGHANMPVEPLKGNEYVDIHFWIGSNSSQDEAAVAAIKTVQLDDFLGGGPVQHRETEGHESQKFLSYFRNGIRLYNGGFETGFHKMVNEIRPSLYQVKGKKRPIMRELNEISWSVMNEGDVFILVAPKRIFIWTGKNSNRMERFAAIKIADTLREENSRFNLSIVIVDDGKESEQLIGDEEVEFSAFLPLDKKSTLQTAANIDWSINDEAFEKLESTVLSLYRCIETEDQIDIKFVKDGPLSRSDLDSNDTFIVDNGPSGIWVWVGKRATPKERSSALKYAMELMKRKNYSHKTELTKVIEDGETIEFKSLFKTWNIVEKDKKNHARLFRMLPKGRFAQIIRFEKSDLEDDNVMVLDTVDKIYIWIGKDLQDKLNDESKLGLLAQFYFKFDKSGRDLKLDNVVFEKQGEESGEFNQHFK